MPLKGKAKSEYQLRYMKRKRSNTGSNMITQERAIKLLKTCHALDSDIQGLGKRENMLDLARYGEISMREVREQIIQQTQGDTSQ